MAQNNSGDVSTDDEGGGQSADVSLGDELKESAGNLLTAVAERALGAAGDKVSDATERLTDYAQQGGGPGLMGAITGATKASEGKSPVSSALGGAFEGLKEKAKDALPGLGGGGGGSGGGGSKKPKVINIVEQIDIGLPVRNVYDLWTQFQDFPDFMKKVESVEQVEDEKLKWKAQIFWSHRTWESTITEQVPDERIVWRSNGEKGYVDGAVTFHELLPDLTRVLLVLVYHPQGFFEKTGNLWRSQGRRARLELKHFRRYAMTDIILHPDDVEGWRGEISDNQVVLSHEDALQEEQEREEAPDEESDDDQAEDQGGRHEDQDGRAEDYDEEEEDEDGEPVAEDEDEFEDDDEDLADDEAEPEENEEELEPA